MLQNLPAELLQHVFLLLSPCTDFPNVLRVCKRWRDVCLEVIRMRADLCSCAFCLRSPLRWSVPRVHRNKTSVQSAPSERFGSLVVHDGDFIYVFGGATNKFTMFNDLWAYDLRDWIWRRVYSEGDLPTPRTYSKGGFIDNRMYLFGGCHSLHYPGWHHSCRIDWLDDLYSFNPTTSHWSRLTLQHVTCDPAQRPPVRAGQSGCFLPSGSDGQSSLLILFGGFSQSLGTCTNDVCIIAPDKGLWFVLNPPTDVEPSVTWPAGRCGHSVCALDAYRMLVMFGNLESPTAPSFEPPTRRQRLPYLQANLEENSQPYNGLPAADLWILTRTRVFPDQDWCSATWFWTPIVCPVNVPGCPSIDFYHASIITLPYSDPNKSYSSLNEPDTEYLKTSTQSIQSSGTTYTVLCISQSTPCLLEEAARQRRTWPRRRTVSNSSGRRNSLSPSSSVTTGAGPQSSCDTALDLGSLSAEHNDIASLSTSPSAASSPVLTDHCTMTSSNPMEDGLPTPIISIARLPPSVAVGSTVSTRRSEDRRAKQLKALAAQERRLFGLRKQSPNASTGSSLGSTSSSSTDATAFGNHHLEWIVPCRPMAVYTLQIHIPCPLVEDPVIAGTWLVARKPHFIDLLFGPQECLGFSCAFAHGGLFLFGGLCDSDEPNDHQIHPLPQPAHTSEASPLSSSLRHLNPDDHSTPDQLLRCSTLSIIPRTSQFFVLQPLGLVGTLV